MKSMCLSTLQLCILHQSGNHIDYFHQIIHGAHINKLQLEFLVIFAVTPIEVMAIPCVIKTT